MLQRNIQAASKLNLDAQAIALKAWIPSQAEHMSGVHFAEPEAGFVAPTGQRPVPPLSAPLTGQRSLPPWVPIGGMGVSPVSRAT